jgi:hypothetical protein
MSDTNSIPIVSGANTLKPINVENMVQPLTNETTSDAQIRSHTPEVIKNDRIVDSANVKGDKVINPEDGVALEAEDSNGSVLVIILQCETKSCDQNITNLKWVFSDPYFTVQVCAVDPPPPVPSNKTLSQSQYNENYCMRKALTYAAEGPYIDNMPQYWWTKIPVIIVKDSSVCNITPSGTTNFVHTDPAEDIIGGMKRRISVALNKAAQADLFFLCKWNDLCNKYTDVSGVTGSIDRGSTLKWSIQPTATQSIMYTPSSRDFITNALIAATVSLSDLLNSNIQQGNLLATVFVPNLIDFDIEVATSSSDYLKLNECDPASASNGSTGTSSAASLIWFAVIVILIILVAWALIQLGPRYAPSELQINS